LTSSTPLAYPQVICSGHVVLCAWFDSRRLQLHAGPEQPQQPQAGDVARQVCHPRQARDPQHGDPGTGHRQRATRIMTASTVFDRLWKNPSRAIANRTVNSAAKNHSAARSISSKAASCPAEQAGDRKCCVGDDDGRNHVLDVVRADRVRHVSVPLSFGG
jgi:hypothetical protein